MDDACARPDCAAVRIEVENLRAYIHGIRMVLNFADHLVQDRRPPLTVSSSVRDTAQREIDADTAAKLDTG